MRYSLLFLLFPIVASGQTYFLNGSAIALADDCYQLTGELNTQNGTVWYAEQIDLLQPFDLQFYMNYGSLDAGGADGICFVLQTVGTAAIGESGGGLGYLNFGTSLGIEFDTWQNTDYGDLWEDHLAIERDGVINHNAPENLAGPVTLHPLGLNVEDGLDHLVRITWDPALQQIRVFYECDFRLGATVDLIDEIFDGENLVYWGFTAATGGAYNNQIVCLEENIIASDDEVYTCPGLPVQLSAGGTGIGTYEWTPADGLDDPFSPSPTATVSETTVYSVVFTDACGAQGTSEITVYVEPVVGNIPEDYELTCHDPSLVLEGGSNYPVQQLDWIWSTTDGNIVSGATTNSPLVNEPGTYQFIISFEGYCADTVEFEVGSDYSDFTLEIPDIELISCNNPEVQITASSDPSDGVSYSWSTVDGTIIGSPNQMIITVNAAGEYFVQSYLNEFCNGTASIEALADFSLPVVSAEEPGVVNCYNETLEITANAEPDGSTYYWVATSGGNIVSGQTTATVTVDQAGDYVMTSAHPVSGCSATVIVTVEEDFTAPVILSVEADTLNCINPVVGVTVNYSSADDVGFGWTTADGNIVSGGTQQTVQVNAAGEYGVVVTNLETGCTDESSGEVIEDELFNFDLSSLEFPNVFTPGPDEKNRAWRPFLRDDPGFDVTQVFNTYDLVVFNRWGNLVFESTNSSRSWSDRDIDEGTYYYILNYSSLCGTGTKGEKAGYVQVLRESK